MNKHASNPDTARVGLIITGVAVLGFFFTFGWFYFYAQRTTKELSINMARCTQTRTAMDVDRVLYGIEIALENQIWKLEQSLTDPEAVSKIPMQIVLCNPMIIGSAVAFKPYYYSTKGEYYMAYSYKDKNGKLQQKVLGGQAYDYFYMDWFQIPQLSHKSYWSEPYFDLGGGDQLMVTYSRPLLDQRGQFYGIITADVSLHWLDDWVARIKPFKRAYAILISRNGYYLAHFEKERILNETVFSATMDMYDVKKIHTIGEHMLSGKTGYDQFRNDDTLSYVVYAPIPRTGWSIATIYPAEDVYDKIIEKAWIIIPCGGLIVLFHFLLVIRNIKRNKKKLSISDHLKTF